jgi:hypothetical protein
MSKYTTINDWEPETRSLLEKLQKHGLVIHSVDNGEYRTKLADTTMDKFIEDCMACDEAWLSVVAPDGKRKTIYLVYGNNPGELMCDYTVCAQLDAVCDEHSESWDGRDQPTKRIQ